jgi:type III secretion system low calcium response chaperone LcrH/SycD
MNIRKTLHAMAEQTDSMLRDLAALPSNGRIPQDAFETVYAMAFNLLTQGQIEQAQRYFALLFVYAPTDVRFVLGLAIAHHSAGRVDDALSMYSLAGTLEPKNPQHLFAMAECFLERQEFEAARSLLITLTRHCAKYPEHEALGGRAQALLDLLTDATVPA